MAFDATLMNFVVIGEVVEKISRQVQDHFPEVPWSQIKSLRNIIAHAYFGVDAEEVWQIIQNDVPVFKIEIRRILEYKP